MLLLSKEKVKVGCDIGIGQKKKDCDIGKLGLICWDMIIFDIRSIIPLEMLVT